MEYKVSNGYGEFSLKNEETSLSYAEVKDSIVQTLNGEIGYIRRVGTTRVHDHGYSAEENIYKIITLDYDVIDLPNMIKTINIFEAYNLIEKYK